MSLDGLSHRTVLQLDIRERGNRERGKRRGGEPATKHLRSPIVGLIVENYSFDLRVWERKRGERIEFFSGILSPLGSYFFNPSFPVL